MYQVRIAPQLTTDQLEQRYRAAKEPHERSWWQILWLLSRGQTAQAVAQSNGYSAYWIGQLAWRYNSGGPEAMHNRQHLSAHQVPTLLSSAQVEELRAALASLATALVLRVQPVHQLVLALLGPADEEFYKPTN
jgi:hypothetical protein